VLTQEHKEKVSKLTATQQELEEKIEFTQLENGNAVAFLQNELSELS
jgi:hypothetical protein